MEKAICKNNHLFDLSKHRCCPVCGAEAQNAYSITAPVNSMDPIGATAPVGAMGGTATPPVMDRVDATQSAAAPGAAFGYDPTTPPINPGFDPFAGNPNPFGQQQMTEPVTPANGPVGFNPVVGWLVCVEGPDRGTDYRIKNGNNFIGRSPNMDICIRNDMHISGENQAIVGYDDIDRTFFFGPDRGRNTVRVNGKMVINSVELAPYDILTVGTTKLVFIPLCGERFDWNGRI